MFEIASVAITTVLSVLVLVDIVGNSLVCAIIKRNREMRYVEKKNGTDNANWNFNYFNKEGKPNIAT